MYINVEEKIFMLPRFFRLQNNRFSVSLFCKALTILARRISLLVHTALLFAHFVHLRVSCYDAFFLLLFLLRVRIYNNVVSLLVEQTGCN